MKTYTEIQAESKRGQRLFIAGLVTVIFIAAYTYGPVVVEMINSLTSKLPH